MHEGAVMKTDLVNISVNGYNTSFNGNANLLMRFQNTKAVKKISVDKHQSQHCLVLIGCQIKLIKSLDSSHRN